VLREEDYFCFSLLVKFGCFLFTQCNKISQNNALSDKNRNKITKYITVDKRNPPPLRVSYAPSGDEGPTVYIQTKEREKNKKKKQLPVARADNNPGVLCRFIQIGLVRRCFGF
jgi:hypothetical protein